MGAPTSTSTIRPRRRIRWRSKHYLSVAMVGALVVIALVSAIFICLAPAHLIFSIADAEVHIYGPLVNNHSSYTHLNFTLVVNNTSPRTAVRYGPITGEISYGPAAMAWVRYDDPGLPEVWWKEPRSSVRFNFSADYGYSEKAMYAVENSQITMVSKVWFSWRGLYTRPYTIRFSCEHVNFKDSKCFPVKCG